MERFVAREDLSEYDLSVFKPMRFKIESEAAAANCGYPGLSSRR
jgi:hypothetical protein